METVHTTHQAVEDSSQLLNDLSDFCRSINNPIALTLSMIKMSRKLPHYWNYVTGKRTLPIDPKEAEAARMPVQIDQIQQQNTRIQESLDHHFKEVNQTLTGMTADIHRLGDAPFSAAGDHLVAAKEAFQKARIAQTTEDRTDYISLYKNHLQYAFNQLSIAKSSGSTKQLKAHSSFMLAQCSLMQGLPETSIKMVDDIFTLLGQKPDLAHYYQMGKGLHQKGQNDAAAFLYEVALMKAALEPETEPSIEAYFKAGNHYKLLDSDEAKSHAETAIALGEGLSTKSNIYLCRSYKLMGNVLSSQSQFEDALPFLHEASAISDRIKSLPATEQKQLNRLLKDALTQTDRISQANSITYY